MLSFQRCHQQLINGPNYKFRQKRLLFSAEPLVDNQAALLRGKGRLSYPGIRFIQLRRAVGQTNCMDALGENVAAEVPLKSLLSTTYWTLP